MRRWRAAIAAALLLPLAALTACGRDEPAAASARARPAVWRATDGARTYWLLGTIHLLPPGIDWQQGAVADAVAASDTLVTELPAGDAGAQAATFLRLGRARGLPPITARVPPGERDALIAAAGAARMPLAALDGLRTWAAALTLTSGTARAAGATRAAAPEAVLGAAFAGRRRAALERFAGQLAVFVRLSEPAQRALLLAAIRGQRAAGAEYGRLLDAWRRGDEAAVAATLARGFADSPELRDALLGARNRAWATQLAARPAGTTLVAVGAGHLVGADGLPALLSARGFRVARVQ